MPLTDASIRNAKPAEKPLKLTDGAGLYLEVTPAGGKHWRYRFRLAGKENLFAIGTYPQITLADARKARDEARELVKQGINPARHRQQQKAGVLKEAENTFAANAEAWFEEKNAPWSDGHRNTVRRILDADILPRIGKTPIRELSAPTLLQVMKKVHARGAVTRAILARQIMGQVFDYAILHGCAENNPTTPLKRQIARRTVEHHKHLEERDIGDFLRKLEDYSGHVTTRTALQLLMMTAVRPGEMCGAAWAEFDLDAATWTIPAARMKMRRVHIVPLARQAVALLRDLEQVTGDGAYLFPTQGTKSQTIPPATLRNAVRKLGYADKFSPHGARGTFSTLMNARGYNADWIEKQLAHDDSDTVRRSYNHTQHLGDRAKMMQDYADLLDEKRQGAQVIQLRKVAA
ncbi:tyrosine-type recombinase/integrase [Thauera mechernichensis]|uniref:Tyrosine-type recombinase/integrase n=1 Tax=Thauera mechernichensis TaxID=82788 RepID=A0ABW3WHH6_9RHOO|nr:integrase arm-type DNA-binding domain-containing protein [Thauera mechernichensis]MDG3066791.1 tyrosine-type recombinase/integrase [Thauera mechernichensis]